jgi:hypothetical protein
MYLPRRVAGILRDPKAEWAVIAAEHDDVASICQSYVAVLALIPAVSILLGLGLIGGRFLGFAGISTAITAAIVSWVMAIASTIVTGVVIEKLAPIFKSDGDMTQALKLVAYASTPVWLAGVFYVVVFAAPLVVVAMFWAVYLLYLGLPLVMKTPPEQVLPYMAVSALAVIVVNVLLRAVFTAFRVPYMGYY